MVAGGEAIDSPEGGHLVAPSLFAGTPNAMRICREEIFGPVSAVIRVAGIDEAIAVANDTPYDLPSGICTTDIRTMERFRRASRAGLVTINAPTAGIDFPVPFGGHHASGMGGKEQGSAAVEFYIERKTTYLNHGVI